MRNYFLRRSFRIFPGYWLALAGAAVLGSSGFHDRVDIVSSVFLVQTFRRLSEFVGVGVAWTLAIEVSFYIMLPIFAFAVRWAGSRLSTVRARLFVQVGGIVSFMGVGASVRAWYLWQHQTQLVVRGQWFTVDAIQVSLPWFVECFAGGLALAVASAYAERSGHIWSPLRLLTHRSSLSWALALGVLAGAAQFRIGGFGAIPIGNAATFLLVPIHGLCAFLFVLPAVFDDGDDDTIARFLGARVMRSLGAISFGVYLWHLTLLRVMTHWVRDGTIHAPSLLLWIAFAVPATLIAASASYLFVERPCIRASHTFERRLRRTQRELHRPRTER